jgi:hypothetical protein
MADVVSLNNRRYRFMAAKWALRSIETRELRVGRLSELNDPFEFVPGIEGLRDDAPMDLVRSKQLATRASGLGLRFKTADCRRGVA